uniref:Uncharacterized protein n=1 Tax=viral metagenome TaxID=1070528 RepID=A0A6H1ZFU3_9ZZZZ
MRGEMKNNIEIENIHVNLVNGQWRQMADQINNYKYDFWADYAIYLDSLYADDSRRSWNYFTDATITYHRIKNR